MHVVAVPDQVPIGLNLQVIGVGMRPPAWAQPVLRLTAVRTSYTQGSAQYTRCGERLKEGSCDHHSHYRHNAAAKQKVLEYSPDAQALLTALCAAVPVLVQALLAVVQHTGQVSATPTKPYACCGSLRCWAPTSCVSLPLLRV